MRRGCGTDAGSANDGASTPIDPHTGNFPRDSSDTPVAVRGDGAILTVTELVIAHIRIHRAVATLVSRTNTFRPINDEGTSSGLRRSS